MKAKRSSICASVSAVSVDGKGDGEAEAKGAGDALGGADDADSEVGAGDAATSVAGDDCPNAGLATRLKLTCSVRKLSATR
jgi:hypothetical protein